MYDLPEKFDEKILLGTYLETVCFGASTTKLQFAKERTLSEASFEISILVECSISFSCDGYLGSRDSGNYVNIASLLGLLMRNVENVKRVGTASLQLFFEPDGYLILDGDASPDFEAYTIYAANGEIFVV